MPGPVQPCESSPGHPRPLLRNSDTVVGRRGADGPDERRGWREGGGVRAGEGAREHI